MKREPMKHHVKDNENFLFCILHQSKFQF